MCLQRPLCILYRVYAILRILSTREKSFGGLSHLLFNAAVLPNLPRKAFSMRSSIAGCLLLSTAAEPLSALPTASEPPSALCMGPACLVW